MDRYEYNVKSDQIKKLYSRKDFAAAAKVADEIDWYRVKDSVMINKVADIYENTKQYEKAKEILLIAYERSPLGRQLAYKLTILSLRTKNFEEAEEFYQDFVEMSPSDVSKYLLKYRIAKAKGERAEVLIKILESYVNVEMDERWQYELAKLYHEAGQDDKCIAMCNELELWFNEGKYVEKARQLRKLISGILEEYNRIYASDDSMKYVAREKQSVKENESFSENEEFSSMKSLAEAIVTNEAEEEQLKEDKIIESNINESYSEEGFGREYNSESEISETKGSSVYEAPVHIESEEEKRAKEALAAAEQAALEAQKAADLAKKLVEEARIRANAFSQGINTEDYTARPVSENRIPHGRGSDKYAGMTFDEMRRQMDKEDGINVEQEEEAKIEIYEFDRRKEGKGKIGDELTKTAEIDIDEIKINLSSSNDLYNTANIQEALAKSMEKLMGFNDEAKLDQEDDFEDDFSNDLKDKFIDGFDEESEEETKIELEVETEEETKTELEVETEEETKIELEVETEEETKTGLEVETEEETKTGLEVETEDKTKTELETETEDKTKTELETEIEEEYFEEEYPKDPTKRIDREELNRLLNDLASVEKEVNPNEEKVNEQIEGQMTLEEVLANMDNSDNSATEETLESVQEVETESEELSVKNEEAFEEDSEDKAEEIEDSYKDKTEKNESEKEKTEGESQKKNESRSTTDVGDAYIMVNKTIPDNYISLFNDFVSVGKMEEDIAVTLDRLINKFEMDGTSKNNNIIITGSSKVGKTTLGLSIIKAANRGRNRSGRKVAKVKATVLNKRGVSLAMTQILGTDLIIEQAGNLMPNTVVDLMIAMKNYTEEMLILLEDDKAAIDRLLERHPDLKGFFNNRLDIEEMEINDMLKLAKEYAAENFYEIDEMGELALCAKLDDISGRNPVISIEDIQEVVDEAIEHANRLSIKNILGKIKRSKGEMGVLTENDFLV